MQCNSEIQSVCLSFYPSCTKKIEQGSLRLESALTVKKKKKLSDCIKNKQNSLHRYDPFEEGERRTAQSLETV